MFGWFKKKEKKPAPAVVGHQVQIVRGAVGNKRLVERAKGRIARLKAKRERLIRKNLPTQEVDAAIAEWEEQLKYSLRQVRNG